MKNITTNHTRTVNTVRALTSSFNRVMGKDAMQSEGSKVFRNGKHVIEFNGEYYANNGKLVEFLVKEFNNVYIALGMVDLDYLTKQLHTGYTGAFMFTITDIDTHVLVETLTETSTQETTETTNEDEELTASAKEWSDNYTAYKNSIKTSADRVLASDDIAMTIHSLTDASVYCADAIVNVIDCFSRTMYIFSDQSAIVLEKGVYKDAKNVQAMQAVYKKVLT